MAQTPLKALSPPPLKPVDNAWHEARVVYLQACGLLDGTAAWHQAHAWTLLDRDFGQGLRLLATYHAWRQDKNAPRILNLISWLTEPLSATELMAGVQAWPELHTLAQELSQQWWGLHPGWNRLWLASGRLRLNLFLGPSNPSAAIQTLGSFTANSIFLSELSQPANHQAAAGDFWAQLAACADERTGIASSRPDWIQRLKTAIGQRQHKDLPPQIPKRVWVLGAGLAGAALARQWAERGVSVQVLEQQPQAAMGASALPAGLFVPHGNPRPILRELTHAGMRHMHHLGNTWLQAGQDWSACGVTEQRVSDPRGKPNSLPNGDLETDTWSRTPGLLGQTNTARHHHYGGWLKPAALVQALLQHPLIECRFNVQIHHLERRDQDHVAVNAAGDLLAQAPVAHLAAGAGSVHLLASISGQPPRLSAVRGQVSLVAMSDWAQRQLPQRCVNGQGSWIPNIPHPELGKASVFGAGFDHHQVDDQVRTADHWDNLARLQRLFPQAHWQGAADTPWRGWAGVRCTAPDRLPWCGPLDLDGRLSVLTALGARGLTLGAVLAEALVCQTLGEVSPFTDGVMRALTPNR